MLKKIIVIALILILIALALIGIFRKGDDKEDLKKITVAEVTHSIFYSPWYVAIEEGYFEDEGLNIEVILTPGADKVAAAVLSGDAEIGFSGPEATIYVYNNDAKDYLVTFAGLTKRDGQFLVGSCDEKNDFKIENLKGKTVLAGRSGGMPLMVFTYALKNAGIGLNELTIDSSVEFAALSGAFIGGGGDYVNLFEPVALSIEKNKYGCVLESIGQLAGEVPYTAYYANKSYFEDNEDVVKSFVKALNKGLTFVKDNEPDVIAKKIIGQFPTTTLEDLTKIVDRYKTADSWWDNTYISKDAYDRLIEIMIYNEVLDEKVDYDVIIDNTYNEQYR